MTEPLPEGPSPGSPGEASQPLQSQASPKLPFFSRVRTFATAILFASAILPAAAIAWWMAGLYRGAVETTEKQIQSSVLAELSSAILNRIEDVHSDVDAVAAALAFAASDRSGRGDSLDAVRAVLATRTNIQAVRFEVPSANVSTVLRHRQVQGADVPPIRKQWRETADSRAYAFTVQDDGQGLIVVKVPPLAESAPGGYVAATVDLKPLAERVREVAETRFDSAHVRILLADEQRHLVAGFGLVQAPGQSIEALPVWQLLPTRASGTRRVGVISEFSEGSETFVGAVETVPALGWAVAVWRPKSEAYQSLSALGPRFFGAAVAVLLLTLITGFFVARAVTEPISMLVKQARLIGQRRWRELTIRSAGNGELGQLSSSLRDMATELEAGEAQIEREARLRGDLSRFMSQDLVRAIVRGEHSLELGGKRATITVLFADVVAFTPLAEGESPERVVSLLNELFSMLSEVVFRHQGTVDKFIGDCLMAVWGAPVETGKHAVLALEAATDMMNLLETANETWKTKYGVELRLAVGINSGEVIVGNIGSEKRMEYTVIGDTVNVAARLEAIAKPNQVLLTSSTRELAASGFEVVALGNHRLTGRAAGTEVYELVLT